ncbi:hypothetical protein SAMN05421759_10810 [Roseivivax lentus]|uniref:Peptidase n=2 Tax=Roseivivax lentus TaxID=633194 RepID=A0A1N7NE64_9RHOB|nr:hypothetical protein SAMN05421759_10810 [Roseivivax lentus]
MPAMRPILFLALALLATACGRPLTDNETAFARALHGDAINPARVRFHDGHFAGSYNYTRPARPRVTCQERIFPPRSGEVTVSPGATTFFNRVLYREDLYRDDFLGELPEVIDLFDAMLFAHEMTHVWQWQNRDRTGFTPWRAALEHTASADPYLFETDQGDFLDYGYEQQGSIVEEYVCCRLLDPDAPRTARLHRMIAGAMDISALDTVLNAPRIRIPWAEAETENICHAE